MVELDWGDLAGWWGAATGSLALGWEVYRHFRSGPRLDVSARACRGGEIRGTFAHVVVDVYNKGDMPTRVEGVDVEQGGVRFRDTGTFVYRYGPRPAGSKPEDYCPVEVPAGGHEPFEVFCHPRASLGEKAFDPYVPAVAYVRVSHSRKQIVVSVHPVASDGSRQAAPEA